MDGWINPPEVVELRPRQRRIGEVSQLVPIGGTGGKRLDVDANRGSRNGDQGNVVTVGEADPEATAMPGGSPYAAASRASCGKQPS